MTPSRRFALSQGRGPAVADGEACQSWKTPRTLLGLGAQPSDRAVHVSLYSQSLAASSGVATLLGSVSRQLS